MLLKGLHQFHTVHKVALLNIAPHKVLVNPGTSEVFFYDFCEASSLEQSVPLKHKSVKSTSLSQDKPFLAPEYHEKGTDLNREKLDIFAMGVLIFQIVFGRPPFSSAKPGEDHLYTYLSSSLVLHQKSFFKFHLRHGVTGTHPPTESLLSLIESMLSKNPVNRPSTTEILENCGF